MSSFSTVMPSSIPAPSPKSLPSSRYPSTSDERDNGTADEWVNRLPSMVRLTGRHPFNAEAETKSLVDAGFLTPTAMHYVRNHGPVPRLDWERHRIKIGGLGFPREVSLSMTQLLELPQRTIPVTLACAGNRRREVNATRQSKGFHWGSGAVSTSVWTGVPLHVLLQRMGFRPEDAGYNAHVCFNGPEGELPKGVYGTSVPLYKALNPASDLLVAYRQNGELLSPDHGFPVRIIVPGHIGGRMVKWLHEISVSAQESDSWYHYHDNRVLPSSVDQAQADQEGWWKRPEYIINELNLNAAISHPAHGEELPLDGTYKVKGYAYCGGGRRISRVELSLDDGETWELANLSPEEYQTEYGRYWCWRLWEFDVDVIRLTMPGGLALRAWDDSQMTQPRDLTWNVLGMMNNCWYKLCTSIQRNRSGQCIVQVEHPAPALVGMPNVGWRLRKMSQGGGAAIDKASAIAASGPAGGAAEIPLPPKRELRRIPTTEVSQHKSKGDLWLIIKNNVYDVTSYIKQHPGGVSSLVMNGGRDATEDFEAIHSSSAWKILDRFIIGTVDNSAAAAAPKPASAQMAPAATAAGEVALRGKGQIIKCRLVARTYDAPDVARLRFALPSKERTLGLQVGLHVTIRAVIAGKKVMRSYTPVSEPDMKGAMELLIRVYRANEHPQFPEGGAMSQHLDRMPIDSEFEFDGPIGHIIYDAPGQLDHLGEKIRVQHFAAVAGGTGITPILQVLRAILTNPADATKFSLVYAARTPADLLCRQLLDDWAKQFPEQFKVWYTIDVPPEDGSWNFSTGFINEEMLRDRWPAAAAEVAVIFCGPPPMMKFAVKPNLKKLGFDEEQVLVF